VEEVVGWIDRAEHVGLRLISLHFGLMLACGVLWIPNGPRSGRRSAQPTDPAIASKKLINIDQLLRKQIKAFLTAIDRIVE
jgi:hypothetical protein